MSSAHLIGLYINGFKSILFKKNHSLRYGQICNHFLTFALLPGRLVFADENDQENSATSYANAPADKAPRH